MTTKIERLVVFGDSLSDIGVKRNTFFGRVAAATGKMRTNQVNRFSDNRNWTDWIWEWAGGSPMIVVDKETTDKRSAKHLEWNLGCSDGSNHGLLFYANYAEGGAMGASDESDLGLGYFSEQVERYLGDIKKTPPKGHGLYLVWFGLNDIVTHGRDPKTVGKVAVEIVSLCHAVLKRDANAHFLIGNLPNPQGAVRFMGKEYTDKVVGFQQASFDFSGALTSEIKKQLGGRGAMVDIYTKMEHVDRNVTSYGLTKGAQPHGIDVYYGQTPANKKAALMTATSDDAHPTEAVYKLIANIWAEAILGSYELGSLRTSGEGKLKILGNK